MAAPTADIFSMTEPAYGLGVAKCGGLTADQIAKTTTVSLDAIYKDGPLWRIMGDLITADFAAKHYQIEQSSLYDFLMSVARPMGTKSLSVSRKPGLAEVTPYILGKRKGIINANYWFIAGSSQTPGTSPGGATYTHYFDLVSQTGIPADARWFSQRMSIYIAGKGSTNLVTNTAWLVQDAFVQNPTTLRVYVTSQNSASALPSGKLEFPTAGRVSRGVPNVSDFDSLCTQVPDLNTNQIAHWWVQTTRWSVCQDELVEQYLTALRAGNPMFREYGDVEQVEVNRQVYKAFQLAQVQTFFWGKPLPNQTLANWQLLDTIELASGPGVADYLNMPGLTGRVVGRRANAVGVYELLAEAGRVKDLAGEKLNIPELLAELYSIKRTRESNNIPANFIEVVTDSSYAVQLRQGFFRYLRNRVEGALNVNIDFDKLTTTLPTGYSFTDIKLDYPAGLTLRIVTHPAIDDLLSATIQAGPGLDNVGRVLWILDFGNSIYPGIIASNSVTNQTAPLATLAGINNEFFCKMQAAQKKVRHSSVTFTAVADCPPASLWIENINPGIPEHCGVSGNVTDLKGDLV